MHLSRSQCTKFLVRLILVFIPLISSNAFGQRFSGEKKYSVSLSVPIWLQHRDYAFSPVRYSGSLHGYSALPTHEFTEDRASGSFRSSLSVSTGRTFKLGSIWNHTEAGVAQIRVRGSKGEQFRFTDQLMDERGFVAPSNFKVFAFQSYNRYLFLRSRLLFDADLFQKDQYFGMGLFAYALLQSGYSLEMQHANGRNYFYQARDLRASDRVYQLTVELSHQIAVYQSSRKTLYWRNALTWPALHFEQVAKRKESGKYVADSRSIRPILETGITLYLHTEKRE